MPRSSHASGPAERTIVFFPVHHRGVVRGRARGEGFEKRLMRLAPASESEEDPGQFWKAFIRETAPVFRTPTIEQLDGFIAPTFQALIDGARHVDERLLEIFDELRPDVIVEDNVVSFPPSEPRRMPDGQHTATSSRCSVDGVRAAHELNP